MLAKQDWGRNQADGYPPVQVLLYRVTDHDYGTPVSPGGPLDLVIDHRLAWVVIAPGVPSCSFGPLGNDLHCGIGTSLSIVDANTGTWLRGMVF